MKELSHRALNFLKKTERKNELCIDRNLIEKHLSVYPVKNPSEILRFNENYSGVTIEGVTISIFTSKQIKEHKGVNTYHWDDEVLFAIGDDIYFSESGKVAFRDCGCESHDFFFYSDSFEVFIEHQAFWEEFRYYKYLPSLAYEITCDIHMVSEYFSDYDNIEECSDSYHYFWKNNLNLVHARLFPEGWSIYIDSLSENARHELISSLKSENLIP